MVFSPLKFLDVAHKLYEKEYAEKWGRTIIGRSYYAAFIYARDNIKARRPDLFPPGRIQEIHRKVREAYKDLGERARAHVKNPLRLATSRSGFVTWTRGWYLQGSCDPSTVSTPLSK